MHSSFLKTKKIIGFQSLDRIERTRGRRKKKQKNTEWRKGMKLLENLCRCVAVSGNEFCINDIIVDEIKNFADEIKTDALGNIVAVKKGGGRKVMITANTDEKGGIVSYIEENGKIRISGMGSFDAKNCAYRKVRFSNSVFGVVCVEGKKNISDLKFSDLYVDIGISGRENVEKKVQIGDAFALDSDFYKTEEDVFAKSLENRAGVYALIEAFKKADGKNSVYAVFTAQKNIGFKGAKLCCDYINPDVGVSVDLEDECENVKCGNGVVLRMRDSSAIFAREFVLDVKSKLEDKKIKVSCNATNKIQTEASCFVNSNCGIKACSMGIAVRNCHTGKEKVNIGDIAELKCAIVEIING